MSNRRINTWFAGLLAGLIALGAGAGVALWLNRDDLAVPQAAAGDDQLLAGLLATTWPNHRGEPVPLAPFGGRVLVVNFWATWCPPCVQEMPELSRVRDEFPRDQVEVLGLGIDTVQRIAPFSVNHPVSYPVFALDTAGIEIARKMGNERGALPYTVVFARNGQVVLRKLGQIHAPELREVIGKALKIGAQ